MKSLDTSQQRSQALDALRGLVMVLMALDHVRDYFHISAFLYDPVDLDQSSPAVFLTRWITHFCAPVFVWLAGTSAWLYGRKHGMAKLRNFLLTRGLWLIVLEFTVVNFAWYFQPSFNLMMLGVIWAIGVLLLVLAALSYMQPRFLLAIGLALIFGHNLLDGISVQGSGWEAIAWAILHQMQSFELGHFSLFVAYPLLPWLGIGIIGYVAGGWFAPAFPAELRLRWLSNTGYLAIGMFVVLRLSDVYGEPTPLVFYDMEVYSFLSLLNTTKYPPSLLFTLMTLGPAMLLLAWFSKNEAALERPLKMLSSIGRVPLFFYVMHIYLIHLLAMLAAELTGFGWQSMRLDIWVNYAEQLQGYGFSLGVTYLIWVGVVAGLYPACIWWGKMKKQYAHRWWMQYL
jgi:uncharacterized membrane protein